MKKMTKFFLSFSLFLMPFFLLAQSVSGVVQDSETNAPVEGVLINADADQMSTISDEDGKFTIKVITANSISLSVEGFEDMEVFFDMSQNLEDKNLNLGVIKMKSTGEEEDPEDLIPTITLNDVETEGDDAALSDNISGLLTASRDPFLSEASFALGQYRFRVRGYDSEHGTLMMNGIPFNELENGRIYWNIWGGLNDVFRNRETEIGLAAGEQAFGGVNGAVNIDTRASSQRKQTRVSYAVSNRSYRNRIMLTHSTGMNANGWAFSFAGSKRWADEGYVEGTVYDGYSYFASIDKKFNEKHLLNLTAFGAPTKRGRIGTATQEVRDLAGSNYYNPLWGYQDGEKRNSRIQNSHQPVAILRHDWTMNEKSTLTTAVSYQTGRNGQTRLDWFNRADPRPNYYRYLPSYLAFGENAPQEIVDARADYLRNNPELLQLNWNQFYDDNRNYVGSIENANGVEGNTVTGNWSRTILEEQRFDADEFNFNSNYQTRINDEWTFTLGAKYQSYVGHTFKVVDDLLGGEFTVDIDRFAERETVSDIESFKQSDLNNPNRIVKEGDVFGWNYDINIRKGGEWAQLAYEGKKWDVFLAGEFESTSIWRDGKFKNGRFPNNSEGESERLLYNNFGIKGGLTYKIDGRNYVYANAARQSKAPLSRYAFVSPRTRNQTTPDLESEQILSYEAGYNLRSPMVKARVTAYYTRFEDQTNRIGFYDDSRRTFGNMILQGIDRTHAGIEAGAEINITSALSMNLVAAIGQNIYTSRQKATLYLDTEETFSTIFAEQGFNVYSNEFFVANGPQEAYSAKLSYRGKGYWFANLNVNFFDNTYVNFSPVRRTETAVYGLEERDPALFQRVIEQEKVPFQTTVDFFGGKSFKFDDKFVYLNVGVSNILNNTEFITGGFEQLRFNYATKDPDNFPSNYFYSFGRTYFISLSLKL